MISKNDKTKAEDSKKDDRIDRERRGFLKVAAALSVSVAAWGLAGIIKFLYYSAPSQGTSAATTSSATSCGFPSLKVSNLSDLKVNQPVTFNYPLDNEPNVLVKLGHKAVGGVGPDGDIVAFSQICQHLGCHYGYQAPGTSPSCNSSYTVPGPVGYCCCHGGVYDFVNGGKVIAGPPPRPVPQVKLEVDSAGNISATGMGPPTIFGHNTGSDNVNDDLQGGNPVQC